MGSPCFDNIVTATILVHVIIIATGDSDVVPLHTDVIQTTHWVASVVYASELLIRLASDRLQRFLLTSPRVGLNWFELIVTALRNWNSSSAAIWANHTALQLLQGGGTVA